MFFGVRYCGGCNPRFDRGEMLRRVSEHFSGRASFEPAKEDVAYDGLLVLGGCSNCCPDYEQFQTKTKPILLWEVAHYDQVVETIEDHLTEAKK